MAQSTTTTAADTLQVYVVRKTLDYAKPKLVYSQFGAPDISMMRQGKTASWLKFNKLSIPSVVLSESPAWVPETVTDSTVTATLELWGNGVELTEMLEDTSFLDLPNEFKELVGINAGETINQKVRDVLFTGTNVVYENSRASQALLQSTDVASINGGLAAAEFLEAQDAPRIGDNYIAIGSPYIKTRFMKDTAFRDAARHLADKNTFFTGELTTIDGVKYIFTSTASTVLGGVGGALVIERTLFLGKGAYGIARLLPGDFKVVDTPPGGHGDEYAVKHSIAWKSYLKTVILQQPWIVRYESVR